MAVEPKAERYPEKIPDEQRGCDYLDEGSVYLRADVGPSGALPSFVEFEQAIPYLEGHFRTFKRVNGTEFLMEAVGGENSLTNEVPDGTLEAHVERVSESPSPGNHAGAYPSLVGTAMKGAKPAFDLLMHVGGSYYDDPADFIAEAKAQGVNKKIPASRNQAPPTIRPGRTRLFLIHPKAIPTGHDEDGVVLDFEDEETEYDDQVFKPGIIGYTYLTRAVYTTHGGETADDDVPKWVGDMAELDMLDIVEIGEKVPYNSPDHPRNDSDDGDEGAGASEAAERPQSGSSTETMDTPSEDETDEGADESGVREDSGPHPLSFAAYAQNVAGSGGDVGEDMRQNLRDQLGYNGMRTVAKEVGVSRKLDANPNADELAGALATARVYQAPVGADVEWLKEDSESGKIVNAEDITEVVVPADEL